MNKKTALLISTAFVVSVVLAVGVQAGDTTVPAAPASGWFAKLSRGATGLLNRKRAPAAANPQATATLGIRGLSADQLRTATPDLQAISRMESFKVSRDEAEVYASRAELHVQNIAY